MFPSLHAQSSLGGDQSLSADGI